MEDFFNLLYYIVKRASKCFYKRRFAKSFLKCFINGQEKQYTIYTETRIL